MNLMWCQSTCTVFEGETNVFLKRWINYTTTYALWFCEFENSFFSLVRVLFAFPMNNMNIISSLVAICLIVSLIKCDLLMEKSAMAYEEFIWELDRPFCETEATYRQWARRWCRERRLFSLNYGTPIIIIIYFNAKFWLNFRFRYRLQFLITINK